MKNPKAINFLWITGSLILFARFFFLLKETFFFHDEWTFINKIIESPFNFVFSPHNGHFMPLFNLVYLLCFKIFGFNYAFYQLLLLMFHFLNAFLLYLIIFLLTKKKSLGIISFFLFLIIPSYWEVLFSFSTIPTVLCLTFMELAIYFLMKFQQQRKTNNLLLSGLFSLFSSFSWGAGIFFPFLLLILVIKDVAKNKTGWLEIVLYTIVGLVSSAISLLFAKSSSGLILNYKKIIEFTLVGIKWEVLSFYTSSPGLVKIFTVVCVAILIFTLNVMRKKDNRKQMLQKLSENKFLIFFFTTVFVYLYLLSAVSRYQIDMRLSMSSRYTYLPLFFLLSSNILILNIFIPFFSKPTRGMLVIYFLFLAISGTYFFNIYYRNWMETISNPNKKIFMQIAKSKSEKERKEIKIPTTFHDFYTAEDIYFISQHLLKDVSRQ